MRVMNMFTHLRDKLREEPIAILVFASASFVLLDQFNLIEWTDGQTKAASAALLAALALVRWLVTPTVKLDRIARDAVVLDRLMSAAELTAAKPNPPPPPTVVDRPKF